MNIHDPNMNNGAQGLIGANAINQMRHDGVRQMRHDGPQLLDGSGGTDQKHPLFAAIQAQRIQDANKFKAARHYSRRVRNLKIGLPIIGALFIVIFIAVAVVAQFSALPLGFAAIDLTNGQVVMERPTLNGFTSSDAEYEIVADRALQDLTDPKKVLLEKINATLTLDDGNIVSIDATQGQFNVEGQHLLLSDGINVHISAGYTGKLESAMIDIKGGTLISNGSVFVKADIGEIRSNRLTVRDNATFILFEDRVRMIVNPQKVRQN